MPIRSGNSSPVELTRVALSDTISASGSPASGEWQSEIVGLPDTEPTILLVVGYEPNKVAR